MMTQTMRTAYSAAAIDPVTSASTAPTTTVVAPLVKPAPTFYEKNKEQIMWGVLVMAAIAALFLAKKYVFKA
jgi:hypothetical protein